MKEERILKSLTEYAKSGAVRLHMPGHKGVGEGLLAGAFACDITELSFSDNLAKPEGVIALAESDISSMLGAKKSRILTGGSTLGVLTMVYAVKNRGKKMIVQKTSHKSVFNALELLGIEPIVLTDKIQDGLITGEFLNDELFDLKDEDLIGALLTSPDYFGRALDLKSIKNRLSSNGKLLLIDGAHGGHLAFENDRAYAGSYADIWVDGAHKTMQTLTQGAILNINDSSLLEGVEKGLSLFSTTSPNYLIMASVESGVKRYSLQKEGLKNEYESAKAYLVNSLKGLGFDILPCDDPLKVTVVLSNKACGLQVGKMLEERGIFAELVSDRYILFMLAYTFNKEQAQRVIDAFKGVKIESLTVNELELTFELKRAISFIQAKSSQIEEIDLKCASGRICAENAGVFPPCYPVIIAGEVFDERVIKALSVNNTFGVNGGKVKVVKE